VETPNTSADTVKLDPGFSWEVTLMQGHMQAVSLAVMTGSFELQVLRIKTDKISNAVTAGL